MSLFNLVGTTAREGAVEAWRIGSPADLARRLTDDFTLAAAAPLAAAIWTRIATEGVVMAAE